MQVTAITVMVKANNHRHQSPVHQKSPDMPGFSSIQFSID